MPEYMMLCKFTQQGIANIKESPKRVESVKKLVEKAGGKFKSFNAALGRFDTVCILEVPDDDTVASISLQISSLGNVKIETLRLFNEKEYAAIINKIT